MSWLMVGIRGSAIVLRGRFAGFPGKDLGLAAGRRTLLARSSVSSGGLRGACQGKRYPRLAMALFPPLDASPDEVRKPLAPLRHDFSVALHSFGNAFAAG